MTPTKWTSCAVEGSLPPAPRRYGLLLPVWSGHSCPLPLTLILLLTLPELAGIPTAASTTVKERTLQRRVKPPKQTLVIPNRAKGPVRNPLLTSLESKTNPCQRETGKGTSFTRAG